MSELKSFLKVLEKYNYPNSKVDVPRLARLSGYNLSSFVEDLEGTIGTQKTFDFIQNTFSKIGLTHDPGLRINLHDYAGDEGSYLYLVVNDFDIIESPEGPEVWLNYSYGDNSIIHDGEAQTIEDMYEDVGLGDLGEWDEFLDVLGDACSHQLHDKTGFNIYMGDRQ